MSEVNFITLTSPHNREISYVKWGDSNKKTLICVHGLTRNARDFDIIAQRLQDKYQIISIDIAGRGRSNKLKDYNNYTYELYINDIISLLNHLKLKKVDWLGTSMGGIIGMIIASKFPEYINKLILNDIGPFIPNAALVKISKYINIYPELEDLSSAKKHLKIMLSHFGIKDEGHWDHMTKHSFILNDNNKYNLSYDPTIGKKFIYDLEQMNGKDIKLWEIWDNINNNVLLIRGKNSDILSHDIANKMYEKGNTDLVAFNNIGHAPALMEENQIQFIYDWLS